MSHTRNLSEENKAMNSCSGLLKQILDLIINYKMLG